MITQVSVQLQLGFQFLGVPYFFGGRDAGTKKHLASRRPNPAAFCNPILQDTKKTWPNPRVAIVQKLYYSSSSIYSREA